jgi:uncharacterized membrane protein
MKEKSCAVILVVLITWAQIWLIQRKLDKIIEQNVVLIKQGE